LGDRFGNLLEAVNQLKSKPEVTVKKVSRIYETDPVLFHCVAPHPRSSRGVGGKKQPVLRSNTTSILRSITAKDEKDEPDYLNAAVEIETVLDTQELVKVCLGIEQDMGRIRTERWGPRTIDIDLLLYGDFIVNPRSSRGPDVTVPHPLMHTRGFVLYPLSDIAPDVQHPVIGQTISQLKKGIGHEGIRKIHNLKLIV